MRASAGHERQVDVELSVAGRSAVVAADEIHAVAVRAALLDGLPQAFARFVAPSPPMSPTAATDLLASSGRPSVGG